MENPLGMKDEVYIWWESFGDPWERLASVGRYLMNDNPDATFYDMFNFIREDLFRGWEYNDNSDFIRSIDYDIEYTHGHKQSL